MRNSKAGKAPKHLDAVMEWLRGEISKTPDITAKKLYERIPLESDKVEVKNPTRAFLFRHRDGLVVQETSKRA